MARATPKEAPAPALPPIDTKFVRALADDCYLDTMHPMAREGVLKAIQRTLGSIRNADDAKALQAAWENIVY